MVRRVDLSGMAHPAAEAREPGVKPDTAVPVLYSFRRCPYAIRARMGLHVAGVAVELREVALRNKPDALLRLSPKGTVPVLQLPDGRVLHESLDILIWALQQSDRHDWLATLDQSAMQQWVLRNDDDFKPLLDNYKYATRGPTLSQAAERSLALDRFVAPLDQVLARRPFLCGAAPGWADLALFPFVRQFAMVEPDWFAAQASLLDVRRWLEFWLGSRWFASAMVKQPVWIDPASDRACSAGRGVDSGA